MANKPAQKKKWLSRTVIIAIIGLIGVCVTTIGAVIVGVFPSLLDNFGFGGNKEQTIVFRITETNGSSLPQAKVILLSGSNVYNEYSDSNGTVSFTLLPSNDLRVFVETDKYEVYDQLLPEKIKNPVEIRLNLKDVDRKSVIIRALDNGTNAPVRGAEVVLIANGNIYSQVADSNGITKFTTDFPEDEIDGEISVTFDGFKIERQRVTLHADHVQDINLDKEAGTLSVSVTGDESGAIALVPTTASPAVIANDVPGTPLAIGSIAKSTIDRDSKPRDIFAVDLSAGQTLSIDVTSNKNISVYLHKAGAISINNSSYVEMCNYVAACKNSFLTPVTGIYYIQILARDSGVQYSLFTSVETTLQPPLISQDVPGTPLKIGGSVISVLDKDIKPKDVHAIDLLAGQTLRITTSSSKNISIFIHKTGAVSINNSRYVEMCNYQTACTNTFLIPVTGTYYIQILARDSGLQYSLSTSVETTLQPSPVAQDVPGTVLQAGSSVSSVLDNDIKPRDIYAMDLLAGQTLRITASSSRNISIYIHKTGAVSINNSRYVELCNYQTACNNTFLIPVAGTYYIQILARDSGLQYSLAASVEATLQPQQVEDDVPGTPVEFGTSIVSVLDNDVKPRDVYAITLTTGQTLRVTVASSKNVSVLLHKIGTTSVINSASETLCNYVTGCTNTFLAPADGIYYLQILARDSGLQYTVSISVE